MAYQYLALEHPLIKDKSIIVTINCVDLAKEKPNATLTFDGVNLLGDLRNIDPLTIYVYDQVVGKYKDILNFGIMHFYKCVTDRFKKVVDDADNVNNANDVYDAVIFNTQSNKPDSEIHIFYQTTESQDIYQIVNTLADAEPNHVENKPGQEIKHTGSWFKLKSMIGSGVSAVSSVITNRSFWELFAKTAAYGSTAYLNYLAARNYRGFWNGSSYFVDRMIDFGSRRDWLIGYNSKRHLWYDLAIASFQSMRGYVKYLYPEDCNGSSDVYSYFTPSRRSNRFAY
jgi:hypothetical protein